MNAWMYCLFVLLLGLAGVFTGLLFSKARANWWMIGYFLPLIFIGCVGAERWVPALGFIVPVSWLTAGHTEYLAGAFAIPSLLATVFSRLTNKRLKVLTTIAFTGVFFKYSVWVFLSHALAQSELAALKTDITKDGVCMQSNGYTCGPAAAITGLKRLGLTGEESHLALEMFTCNAVGTEPDILAATLNRLYAKDGLRCEYRHFDSLEELKRAGITIVIIKFDWTTDHYVTVLEVTADKVIAGDPLAGIQRYSHEEFEEIWKRVGIVMKRAE